jgi:hypothetical protein
MGIFISKATPFPKLGGEKPNREILLFIIVISSPKLFGYI